MVSNETRVCWLFQLDPPSDVEPPESALREAMFGVADFLRAKSVPIGTRQLVLGAATRSPSLAEGDVAWAIHRLAQEMLLKVEAPRECSPQRNPYGYTSRLDGQDTGQCSQQNFVALPFDDGIVSVTEALWTWRRKNDAPRQVAAGNTRPDEGAAHSSSVFRHRGGNWEIRFAQEHGSFPVKGNKGLQHIANLLSRPYRPLSGIELQGHLTTEAEHSFHEVNDKEAFAKVKKEVDELQCVIAKARRDGNEGELNVHLKDLNSLLANIQKTHGLAGRGRRLGSQPQASKDFDAVRRSVSRALSDVRGTLPMFVKHMKLTLKANRPDHIYIPAYDHLYPHPDWIF
jgi:hypothetical protein